MLGFILHFSILEGILWHIEEWYLSMNKEYIFGMFCLIRGMGTREVRCFLISRECRNYDYLYKESNIKKEIFKSVGPYGCLEVSLRMS